MEQCAMYYGLAFPRSIICKRFIQAVVCTDNVSLSLLSTVLWCECATAALAVHQTGGHMTCLQVLVITDKASINSCEQVFI